MLLLLWRRLPLLILIQLFEPYFISEKLYTGAFVICKSTVCPSRQPGGRFGRFPCLRQWGHANCYRPRDPYVGSLIPGTFHLSLPTRLIGLSSFPSNFFPSNSPIYLQKKLSKSRSRRVAASVDRANDVPTLTPLQENDSRKSRKHTTAAVVGGAGAALLVAVILVFVYMCLMRIRTLIRRTSETESSVPSPPIELERVNTYHHASAFSPYDTKNLRQLTMLELQHATNNFSPSCIVGEGAFGFVYKGLLQDGSIAAIKRSVHAPVRNFLHQIKHITCASHKHLVKLVGYCEESNHQLLVYDYISNGNVGNHLYDSEGLPKGKLNMRQRLLIALGAAKGLEYLHTLVPPLPHMHFRTSNVLLDENLTAKLSDYGLLKLLSENYYTAASSSAIDCFLDPELYSSNKFSTQSDAYSFGVFLLELISGRPAHARNLSDSEPTLILQAKDSETVVEFMDKTLGNNSIRAAKQMMDLALQCIDIGIRRPTMRRVVEELERIQEREIGHLPGEDIGVVTLGSELFR